MNEQLRLLIELQKLDSQIIAYSKTIKAIPQKISAMDAPIEEAQANLEKANAKLQDMEKNKRERELAVEEVKDKIEKAKERTAAIKDNKAYHAHLKEIENLEKSTISIDDEVLAIMEEMDSFGTETKAATEALETEKARAAAMKKTLDEEEQQAKKELERMMSERGQFVDPIEEKNFALYKKIITEEGGLAVAPVDNEICGGCYMNVMPQLIQTIKKGDTISQCPQCKRILYFEQPDTESA